MLKFKCVKCGGEGVEKLAHEGVLRYQCDWCKFVIVDCFMPQYHDELPEEILQTMIDTAVVVDRHENGHLYN